MAWFLNQGGRIHGPFDAKKIKLLVAAGKVKRDATIGKSKSGPWRAVGDVKELAVLQNVAEAHSRTDPGGKVSRNPTDTDDAPAREELKSRPILWALIFSIIPLVCLCVTVSQRGSTQQFSRYGGQNGYLNILTNPLTVLGDIVKALSASVLSSMRIPAYGILILLTSAALNRWITLRFRLSLMSSVGTGLLIASVWALILLELGVLLP